MNDYQRGANDKRGEILDQMEDVGIFDRLSTDDRQLMMKLLVWDERAVDEYGKIITD